MTKLAQLIARREGFGIPGTKPTRDHNPGDLKHAPHIHSWDGAIGIEPNDAAGWEDLERQLRLYAGRGLTLAQMVAIYAPSSENDSAAYLRFICAGLGLPANTPVSEALELQA